MAAGRGMCDQRLDGRAPSRWAGEQAQNPSRPSLAGRGGAHVLAPPGGKQDAANPHASRSASAARPAAWPSNRSAAGAARPSARRVRQARNQRHANMGKLRKFATHAGAGAPFRAGGRCLGGRSSRPLACMAGRCCPRLMSTNRRITAVALAGPAHGAR
jgi:hypothetical protein